ncbi:MAG TPA: putative porin [Terriglobales bacterium]|nr:putative porin [Terriglobales bacterium]
MKKTIWFLLLAMSALLHAQANPGKTKSRRQPKKRTDSVLEHVQALENAVATQQQQIQQLTNELKQRDEQWAQFQQDYIQAKQTANQAQTQAATAETTSEQASTAVAVLKTDVAKIESSAAHAQRDNKDLQKRISGIEGVLSRFRVVGDIRLRSDSIFQTYSGCAACVARNRARVRLRLGLEGRLGEDFIGGVYVASGANVNGVPSLADPTSTNETLTNFFERKAVGFDRGYIIYQPHAAKWIKLTGGKFAYDWEHTDLTFDPDLNPEGFTEKLSFDFGNPVVKNFSVEAMQLLFNEVAGGLVGTSINRGVDSNAFGGQAVLRLQPAKTWTSTPSVTVLNWNGADPIAQAAFPVLPCASATSTGCIQNPLTPAVGTPLPPPLTPAVRSLAPSNIMTNATFIAGTGTSQRRAFISGFEYADLIWDNTILTPWQRFPWHVTAEYERNLRARQSMFAPSRQNKGYWFDTNVGAQKQKNDLQLGYNWMRIEQDAVISQFNESEMRAPTNVLENHVYVNWLLRGNTTASFNWWLGRTLNRNLQNAALAPGLPKGLTDPWLNRLQFDLIYKF